MDYVGKLWITPVSRRRKKRIFCIINHSTQSSISHRFHSHHQNNINRFVKDNFDQAQVVSSHYYILNSSYEEINLWCEAVTYIHNGKSLAVILCSCYTLDSRWCRLAAFYPQRIILFYFNKLLFLPFQISIFTLTTLVNNRRRWAASQELEGTREGEREKNSRSREGIILLTKPFGYRAVLRSHTNVESGKWCLWSIMCQRHETWLWLWNIILY